MASSDPLWNLQWFTFDALGLRAYQRDLNEKRVKKIVSEWSDKRAKPPYVAIVKGIPEIIDGQHTCAARKERGEVGVWALSREMSANEAAQTFRWFNGDAVKLSNFQDWEAGRYMEDPKVIEADKMVESLGFKITGYSSPATIACIWHVKQMLVVKGGGVPHLGEVIALADAAWSGQDQVFRGEILAGISQVIRKYGDKVNREKAIRSWSKDFTPIRLVHAAKERNVNENMKKENAVSSLLVKSHDARLGPDKKLRKVGVEEF